MNNLQTQPYVASADENEAISILVRSIMNAIQESEGNFDRTFKTVVTKVSGTTYTIRDQGGIERKVKCAIPGFTPKPGTSVWVTLPCNNLSRAFISGQA